MKFGTMLAVLTFCAGATFTLVDIGADTFLAFEYWNISCNFNSKVEGWPSNGIRPFHNGIFAKWTTFWIGLGGIAQTFLVARFLFRGDDRLIWLPKSIRILLLLSSPVLLGPVIINVFGAF